ncbi:MAG: hypothetical protein K2X27_19665 [Candidatus Obscuribacterales bacterium]|nr:hypothetical protein [Candidatus Obscuribacterales bacterium]
MSDRGVADKAHMAELPAAPNLLDLLGKLEKNEKPPITQLVQAKNETPKPEKSKPEPQAKPEAALKPEVKNPDERPPVGQKALVPGALTAPAIEIPAQLKIKPELNPSDWRPPVQLSAEDLSKSALKLVKTDANDARIQAEERAAGQGLVKLLSGPERVQADLLRMKLSVSSEGPEREALQSELQTFLKNKLGEKASAQGVNELTKPYSTTELLAEIQNARKEEIPELLNETRKALEKDAALAISDADKLKDFSEKLKTFESRAAARPLSDSEVFGTYVQMARVLNPSLRLAHGDKGNLVRSMLANAADPFSIDQGGHNTCNVTAMQVRLYAQEPQTPSKVVADIAVTGQFKTADGTIIKPLSLAPDGEAQQDPVWDGGRNFASQIFQMVAINTYWNRRDTMPGGKNVGKGNIQYAQGDDGEYLLDVSVNPPLKQ